MRAGTLTWLALRDLWISFRFVALLALSLAGGVVAGALPPGVADPTAALAWGAVLAGSAAAAVLGGSVAAERVHGRLGWLAVRSVPRSAVLVAWAWSVALPVLLGLAAAGLLAWLAVAPSAAAPLDALAFAGLVAAAACALAVGLAAALLLGALLAPPLATLASLVVAGAIGVGGLLTGNEPATWPGAAIGLLAHAVALDHPLAGAFTSAGVSLAAGAVLLALAAAVVSRVDL